MIKQAKDKFYDEFLREPTKDNFRCFLKNNCGELDEVDFKKEWIEKGHLAKTILAMGNSRGGIIVVGVEENADGSLNTAGLKDLKNKAAINDEIAKYLSPSLDYEILDFVYDTSEYEKVTNKKFQLLIVHDTPDRLPFISLNATTDLEKDVVYIRRGTKCEKASAEDIERLIECKIETIFKGSSDLSLKDHLIQLKELYNELPQKIKVLVRKGEPTAIDRVASRITEVLQSFCGSNDEYEEEDNPNYPKESYEAFILRMIKNKKLKIEKVLDTK